MGQCIVGHLVLYLLPLWYQRLICAVQFSRPSSVAVGFLHALVRTDYSSAWSIFDFMRAWRMGLGMHFRHRCGLDASQDANGAYTCMYAQLIHRCRLPGARPDAFQNQVQVFLHAPSRISSCSSRSSTAWV